MRQWFALVVGSWVTMASVSAQSPVQPAVGTAPAQAPAKLQLVGGCSAGCGATVAGPVIAAPAAGASCGCTTSVAPSLGLFQRLLYPVTIGEGCRSDVNCSSFAAERTFMFGSCRQFFNPGNKCNLCNKPAPYTIHGPGGLGNQNNCVYGTFLNR